MSDESVDLPLRRLNFPAFAPGVNLHAVASTKTVSIFTVNSEEVVWVWHHATTNSTVEKGWWGDLAFEALLLEVPHHLHLIMILLFLLMIILPLETAIPRIHSRIGSVGPLVTNLWYFSLLDKRLLLSRTLVIPHEFGFFVCFFLLTSLFRYAGALLRHENRLYVYQIGTVRLRN